MSVLSIGAAVSQAQTRTADNDVNPQAVAAAAPDAIETARPGMVTLFNGTNLDGWAGDTKAWTVRDGAITGDTRRGGFLLYTKDDYDHFRLIFRSRLVSRENHLGIGFWGKREPNSGYGGCLLVIPPDGGMWDYITNKTPPREQFPHDPPFDPHQWHQTEILANLATGEVQVAVNGFKTTRYKDVDPARHQKGPIGLQLHGGASVVQYKDIQVEANPRENRLLTLKP